MANQFTQKAQGALQNALSLAGELGHTYVGSEHLLLGLISQEDSISSRLLRARGADPSSLRRRVEEIAGSGSPHSVSSSDVSPRLRQILSRSARISAEGGCSFVGTEHLLLALLEETDSVGHRILEAEGIPIPLLHKDVSSLQSSVGESRGAGGKEKKSEEPRIHGAPTLSAHGRDLTRLAEQGRLDPVIGREEETRRLIHILCRRTKNNPCLIGEPGVGKTAVVEGLALRIAEGSVPEILARKRVISLDLASMIAGAKYRGEFEDRMKRVMEEVRKSPELILFLDELHMMMGAGAAEGAVDAANILKPALSRGELQMIGATTLAEYRKHIERDAALERRFQTILLEEPSPEQAEEILRGLKGRYESHHGLSISDEAIRAAVRLSHRYLPDRFLPDKAIDLLDEAAAQVRLSLSEAPPAVSHLLMEMRGCEAEKEQAVIGQDFQRAALLRGRELELRSAIDQWRQEHPEPSRPLVGADAVAAAVTARTGIPVGVVLEEEGARLSHLGERLKHAVLGQDEAVDGLVRAIRRGRCGLKEPSRPVGSFLLLGQTGVGKTELSRALAQELFGSDRAMVRLDMSEFSEKHTVSRLLGAPPGYVGYGEGGQLTEPIRRRPYSVLLLDEIDKAHPDLWNLLLQLLEEGRLTDAAGRLVDFTNTVILLTANLSPDGVLRRIRGFSDDVSLSAPVCERERRHALEDRFPSELLNRLDEVLWFHPLELPQLTEIAAGLLEDLRRRGDALGISLSFDPSLSAFLAERSFDRRLGARPLRRAVERFVEDPLSSALLEGRIRAGDRVECRPSAEGEVELLLSVSEEKEARTP